MKRFCFAVSVLTMLILGLAAFSWAGEASVFDTGEKIIVRAFAEAFSVCSNDGTLICAVDSDCGQGNSCAAPVPAEYAATLEIRDTTGSLMPLKVCSSDNTKSCTGDGDCEGGTCINAFSVTDLSSGIPVAVTVASNPFDVHPSALHPGTLSSPDLSMSFDSDSGLVYLFCTNTGVHTMKYQIINNIKPVDGVCGSANNQSSYSAPNTGLCDDGSLPTVSGTGPWTWTCQGTNGGNPSPQCLANKKADGVCGSASSQSFYWAPNSGLCGDGSLPTVSGTGPWTWFCQGANGGNPSSQCSANKKVDGACGSADGKSYSTAPTNPAILCNAGTPSPIPSGSGPWNWTCQGVNSDVSPGCSAQVISNTWPDLVISAANAPNGLDSGQSFTVSLTIKNQGDAAAGAFTVKGWWSADNIGGNTGDQLLFQWDIPGLGVGATTSKSFSGLSVRGTIHQYYCILVLVDSGGQVSESNETNNKRCMAVMVQR